MLSALSCCSGTWREFGPRLLELKTKLRLGLLFYIQPPKFSQIYLHRKIFTGLEELLVASSWNTRRRMPGTGADWTGHSARARRSPSRRYCCNIFSGSCLAVLAEPLWPRHFSKTPGMDSLASTDGRSNHWASARLLTNEKGKFRVLTNEWLA